MPKVQRGSILVDFAGNRQGKVSCVYAHHLKDVYEPRDEGNNGESRSRQLL